MKLPSDERGRVIRSLVSIELRCELCGVAIEQRVEGRPRRFCGTPCRAKAHRLGAVPSFVAYNAAERSETTGSS